MKEREAFKEALMHAYAIYRYHPSWDALFGRGSLVCYQGNKAIRVGWNKFNQLRKAKAKGKR